MLFQITRISFIESEYARLDSLIRIMTQNGAKDYCNNGFKLVLSGTCQKSGIKKSP